MSCTARSSVSRCRCGIGCAAPNCSTGRIRQIAESGTDHILDKAAVVKMLDDHRAGAIDHSRRLWTVLMFMVWHGIFVEERIVPQIQEPAYPVERLGTTAHDARLVVAAPPSGSARDRRFVRAAKPGKDGGDLVRGRRAVGVGETLERARRGRRSTPACPTVSSTSTATSEPELGGAFDSSDPRGARQEPGAEARRRRRSGRPCRSRAPRRRGPSCRRASTICAPLPPSVVTRMPTLSRDLVLASGRSSAGAVPTRIRW